MDSKEFLEIRKKLSKTQKEVAQLLGISLKAVCSYEQGWRTIPSHVERQLFFLLAKKCPPRGGGVDCWKLRDCPEEKRKHCPAWEFDSGQICWFISGTLCESAACDSWEKKIIGDIEHAIFAANLGITPQNDGEMIRITIPPLTEDRRKDLVKQVKHHGEETKIALRSIRHKLMDQIKKEKTNGLSEDIAKSKEAQAQAMLNDYVVKVDHIVEAKDKELMTV